MRQAMALRFAGIPRSFAELERSARMLGILRQLGFHNSIRMKLSVDGSGTPVPWWTYAANEWLGPRLRPSDSVFEYGCGSSTLWLATRVASIVSVEHDEAWHAAISSRLPSNGQVVFRPSGKEDGDDTSSPYSSAIKDYSPPYDIIIIDGMERNACARLAPAMLAEDGIVIFDNSHREAYVAGFSSFGDAGFLRIDFSGCVPDRSVTSIFCRNMDRWCDGLLSLKDVGT